jgi:CLIP-associating protein 1/2
MSKVMESQVGELLTLMRSPDVSVDVKISGINDVKSGIKHFNVPDASVPQLFDILRLAMQSQNVTLVTSGFGMFWWVPL